MHFEFEFNDEEIRAALKRVATLTHNADIMRKLGNVVLQEAESAFDNEASPEGQVWSELTEPYKTRRYTKGYTGKKLQVSGDLVKSLDMDYGDNFALVGVSEPYGQFHQFGTVKMAARPFLGIGEDGLEEIAAILQRELGKIWR